MTSNQTIGAWVLIGTVGSVLVNGWDKTAYILMIFMGGIFIYRWLTSGRVPGR